MKKLIFLFVIFSNTLLFSQINGVAEKKEVVVPPTEVKAAFDREFPNQFANWQMEYRGDDKNQLTYETNLIYEKQFAVAYYDKLGNLTAIEIEIHTRELPEKTLNYLQKNYPNAPLSEAVKIYKGIKAQISYEVGFMDKAKFEDLVFDSNGDFLTKVTKTKASKY